MSDTCKVCDQAAWEWVKKYHPNHRYQLARVIHKRVCLPLRAQRDEALEREAFWSGEGYEQRKGKDPKEDEYRVLADINRGDRTPEQTSRLQELARWLAWRTDEDVQYERAEVAEARVTALECIVESSLTEEQCRTLAGWVDLRYPDDADPEVQSALLRQADALASPVGQLVPSSTKAFRCPECDCKMVECDEAGIVALDRLAEDKAKQSPLVKDLAMLVRRLTRRLPPNNGTAQAALDFLRRKQLHGDPLR